MFLCLQQAAKEVSQALNNCVNFLPGQRDVDEAIKAVVDSSQSLAVEDVSALLASQVSSQLSTCSDPFHEAVFKRLSKVITPFHFQLLLSVNWLKYRAPVFQPMRSKTDHTLYARFFLHVEQITGNCLKF